MAEPDTLMIPYEGFGGARFAHVGRYGESNQFLGCITYAAQYVPKFYWTEKVAADEQPLFREHANCFAVLHRFDPTGRHLGTDVERVGGTEESNDRDWAKLDEMIASLGDPQLCDIRIKPFRIEIDKIVYGLIYEHVAGDDQDDRSANYEHVMLEPNDIMFHPPWDSGEYST